MAPHVDSLPDVTALFLVRLRFEPGSVEQMRAEVRTTHDVSAGFEASATVTDVEAAVVLLREWFRAQVHAVLPSA